MKAAFSKSEIIFSKEMFPLEGFSGIHDNPHVRMMYLEYGKEKMALAAVELVNVPQRAIEYCQRVISDVMDIPTEKVWVHMTHAITTPHEPGTMGPPGRRPYATGEDLRKRKLFYNSIEAAIDQAAGILKADVEEAYSGWGTGECLANQNRDVKTPYGWWIGENGTGPSNHEMKVLKIENVKGKLKGIFVNYGIKPCAIDNSGMRNGERLVSSECTGMACSLAEEKLGAPVLFVMGAAGDQIPLHMSLHEEVTDEGDVRYRDEGVEKGFAYAAEAGNMMCDSMIKIVAEIMCKAPTEENELCVGWKKIEFLWKRRKASGPYRIQKELTHEPDGEAVFSAEVFRLGDTFFLAERPEVNTKTELELMEACPLKRVILMTMVNGEMKYLPDKESFEKSTWEAQSALLMPGAAEKFVEEATAAMNALTESEAE